MHSYTTYLFPLNYSELGRILGLSHISYNSNILDVVLHVITYRCHCLRQGLTHTHILESHIDANILNVVLLAHIYRCHGLTRTSHIGILCHDICILAIPKVHTGLSYVVTQSKRIHKHSCQACTHSANACIYSHIHFCIYSSHLIKINNVYLLINLPSMMKNGTGRLVDNFSFPPIHV
ncbi:Cysteine--tRNA ligase [Gossypium arboreum]|uniref:Cysteine--tRNA ligase n=1 Tax=Gossypium arboreum TaxID=29729 RepID=A0A0B0NE29_GOSAR|nr:Cysteine--tRNA ligase [Gossypium arboreum]